jgi:polygalacturonase
MFKRAIAVCLASCLVLSIGCAAKALKDETVPSGTKLEVELLDGVSSADSSTGDAVNARVAQDIVVGGKVVIPAGTTVSGRVTEAHGLKAIGGRARLRLEFETVDLATGEAPIRAAFYRQGKSETKKDAATIGGAIVGGAAGTAIAAGTKGEEIVLPAGTRLAVHLQSPVTVKVEA